MDSYNSPTTKPLYRGIQIVWYLTGIVEILLALRFILKLLGANSYASFTDFIYMLTEPLSKPFLAVLNGSQMQGSYFEWATILAMAVYALIGWGIVKLFSMSKTISTPEAARHLR